ncbi:unnamed protein product [Chironomus riparius]|uniref:ZAD domain-containing protein n=1 Tax=Chironomus riparius TaxID=315576 RepID=A0A9N9S6Q9_9DIPT|nr:unnamed protein product [Chironomus riparius]
MSIDGKMCRVCLATQSTSKFNQIFENNGKLGKQIYELTGIKILEFRQCLALICLKCTINLQLALELRDSILDNNRHFNEIYKICQFEEYDIDFSAIQPSQWPVDPNVMVKSDPTTSSDFTFNNPIGNFHPLETEEYIISEVIKEEPRDEVEEFTNETKYQATIIKSEITEEPEEIQELNFSSLPIELLHTLDSNNSTDCDNYLDELGQPTSQYSSELDRQENSLTVHQQNRRALSPNQLERKRARDRLRKQQKRLAETEEEREARKIANAARQRKRRELMKDYNLKRKISKLKKRNNETEEQRQKRLESERLRMAAKRKTENEEQRQKRLEAERNRVALKRKTESEEKRRIRLEAQRIRVAQRRNAKRSQNN